MFRLPTCPYCDTVYHYGDIVKMISQDRVKKKQEDHAVVCYHCEKRFTTKYIPGVLILTAIWAVLSIVTNIILLSRMTQLNLVVMFIMTIVYMALAILLLPFFVRFIKCEKEKKKKK